MKLLVTGGRDFWDEAQMRADLQSLVPLGLSLLIHGKNPNGADLLADRLGRLLLGDAGVLPCEAKWELYGNSAGPRRNIEMLDDHHPDLVLGYPTRKSVGTWHCIAEAADRRIPVLAFIPWWTGDIAELVERETRPHRKVATGARKGTHVRIVSAARLV